MPWKAFKKPKGTHLGSKNTVPNGSQMAHIPFNRIILHTGVASRDKTVVSTTHLLA